MRPVGEGGCELVVIQCRIEKGGEGVGVDGTAEFMAVVTLLRGRSAEAMRSEPGVFVSTIHAPRLTRTHV